MGYYVELTDVNFRIKKENNTDKDIVAKIKEQLLNDMKVVGSGGTYETGKEPIINYAWVDTEEIIRAKSIADLLNAFGYNPECDDENIISLWHGNEKIGNEKHLFKVISPYIEDGSYLSYCGEDMSLWQWSFDKGIMIEKTGKVVYE